MSNLATKLANDIHAAVLTKLAGTPMPTGNQAPMQQQAAPVVPKPATKPMNAGALSPKTAPVAHGVNNGTATLPLKKPAPPQAQAPRPNMGQRPQSMTEATANLLRSKGYKPNAFRQNSNGNWESTPPQLIAGTRG